MDAGSTPEATLSIEDKAAKKKQDINNRLSGDADDRDGLMEKRTAEEDGVFDKTSEGGEGVAVVDRAGGGGEQDGRSRESSKSRPKGRSQKHVDDGVDEDGVDRPWTSNSNGGIVAEEVGRHEGYGDVDEDEQVRRSPAQHNQCTTLYRLSLAAVSWLRSGITYRTGTHRYSYTKPTVLL